MRQPGTPTPGSHTRVRAEQRAPYYPRAMVALLCAGLLPGCATVSHAPLFLFQSSPRIGYHRQHHHRLLVGQHISTRRVFGARPRTAERLRHHGDASLGAAEEFDDYQDSPNRSEQWHRTHFFWQPDARWEREDGPRIEQNEENVADSLFVIEQSPGHWEDTTPSNGAFTEGQQQHQQQCEDADELKSVRGGRGGGAGGGGRDDIIPRRPRPVLNGARLQDQPLSRHSSSSWSSSSSGRRQQQKQRISFFVSDADNSLMTQTASTAAEVSPTTINRTAGGGRGEVAMEGGKRNSALMTTLVDGQAGSAAAGAVAGHSIGDLTDKRERNILTANGTVDVATKKEINAATAVVGDNVEQATEEVAEAGGAGGAEELVDFDADPLAESYERGRWLLGLLVLQSTSSYVLDHYQVGTNMCLVDQYIITYVPQWPTNG